MKLVIAGGRDLQISIEDLDNILEHYIYQYGPPCEGRFEIIEGGAKGIDRCARDYAKHFNIPFTTFDAEWDDLSHPDAVIKKNKFGKKYDAIAGHRRNQKMAEEGTHLLVIWNGKSTGSKDMKTRMKKLGKPIFEVIKK